MTTFVVSVVGRLTRIPYTTAVQSVIGHTERIGVIRKQVKPKARLRNNYLTRAKK